MLFLTNRSQSQRLSRAGPTSCNTNNLCLYQLLVVQVATIKMADTCTVRHAIQKATQSQAVMPICMYFRKYNSNCEHMTSDITNLSSQLDLYQGPVSKCIPHINVLHLCKSIAQFCFVNIFDTALHVTPTHALDKLRLQHSQPTRHPVEIDWCPLGLMPIPGQGF